MASPLIPIGVRERPAGPEEASAGATFDESDAPEAAVEMSFVGIESRTRLTTSFGDVPAHLLRVNDSLRTADKRYVKIRKIDVLKLDHDFLSFHPGAQPVRIGSSALGPGLPQQDLYLAPHQVLFAGARSFETKAVTAASLLSRPRVGRAPCEQVSYYRLILDTDASIFSEKTLLRIEMPSGPA